MTLHLTYRDCKVITESSEVLRQSNRLSGDKDAQACQGNSEHLCICVEVEKCTLLDHFNTVSLRMRR